MPSVFEPITYVQELLAAQPSIDSAWLMGSYGRGDQDTYSDFDFGAYVPTPANADRIFQALCDHLENNPTVVFSKPLPHGRTVNTITEDWQRIDITVLDSNSIRDLASENLKFLYGQEKAEVLMKPSLPEPTKKNSVEIQSIAHEFIRVLGLATVVVGREDYVLGQSGAELLRGLLIRLMSKEKADGITRGALSMRKALTVEQYNVLSEIPPMSPQREPIFDVYKYLAKEFFRRGRDIMKSYGLEWPTRFEEATRRSLDKIGLKI